MAKLTIFRSKKTQNWIGPLNGGLIVGHKDLTPGEVAAKYAAKEYSVSDKSILIGFTGGDSAEIDIDLSAKVKRSNLPSVSWEEETA